MIVGSRTAMSRRDSSIERLPISTIVLVERLPSAPGPSVGGGIHVLGSYVCYFWMVAMEPDTA